jgi:tetratricopeptide (TPR) repeat protein
LAQAGKLDQGIVELRRVVEQDPGDARARLNLGVALAESGDLTGAIAQHLAVLELRPENDRLALTHFNLGTFYKRTNDPDNAVEHYRRALELDAGLAGAHYDLGELLSGSGHLSEALSHYSSAGELRPDQGSARLGHATVLMRLERFPEARRVLEKGVRELPADRRLANALARVLAAAPERSLRDGPRALAMATQVFETERVPPYAETLAMALAAVGRFEEAVRIQRRVLAEAERLSRSADASRLKRNLDLYENGRACCAGTADVFPPR